MLWVPYSLFASPCLGSELAPDASARACTPAGSGGRPFTPAASWSLAATPSRSETTWNISDDWLPTLAWDATIAAGHHVGRTLADPALEFGRRATDDRFNAA